MKCKLDENADYDFCEVFQIDGIRKFTSQSTCQRNKGNVLIENQVTSMEVSLKIFIQVRPIVKVAKVNNCQFVCREDNFIEQGSISPSKDTCQSTEHCSLALI